jgi:hypothetical protein
MRERGLSKVGDFMVIDDRVYYHDRGGWRPATDEEVVRYITHIL